jgi:hypothetical protein
MAQRKGSTLLEGPHALTARPSGRTTMQMKTYEDVRKVSVVA